MIARPAALRIALAAVAFALLPTAAGAAAVATDPGVKATTTSYVFKLSIGMPEHMWTLAQVKAKHPTTGEVMLMGSMGGAMSMGGSQRHLEVHIFSRATGKVVVGAHPTIKATDATIKNAMTMTVPAAEMKGVTSGVSDVHYGNNVSLVGGHLYRVTVSLRGEHAVLAARAPK